MTTTFKSLIDYPGAVPTLNANINDAVTTIVLAAGTGAYLPASNFWVTIDSEQILVATRATDTLTCTGGRGANGTVAAAHSSGTSVFCYITKTHYDNLGTAINNLEDGTTPAAATAVAITDDTTTDATMYPTWVTANTGDLPVYVTSTKLSFNPSTGLFTATGFSGPLTGAVTGDCSGSSGSCTGLAATATALATARAINGVDFNGTAAITVPVNNANSTTAANMFVLVSATQGGNYAALTNAGLKFNPSTGMLTATGLTGPLTGTASNATQLGGKTWAAPDPLGSGTPNTISGSRIGAGVAADANIVLLAQTSNVAYVPLFERSGQTSTDVKNAANLLATHTGDMGDGFGCAFFLNIRDNAGVINPIGTFGAVRAGADNTGNITLSPIVAGTGVAEFILSGTTGLTLLHDLAVNGGDLTSTAAAFNFLATSAWINMGLACTSYSIGAYTGTCTINNDILAAAGTTLTVGANSTIQGHLVLWDGAAGNTPAYVQIHSPNGTAWYVFVEDDGTLKMHNAAPTQNADGSVVGVQT